MAPRSFLYVTSNPTKFLEVDTFVKEHEADTLTLKRVDADLVEIQTLDHKAIALDKARQAWELFKEPVLIDDAGIYFEKYTNFPGTLTKYVFEGIGFEGIFKLIESGERATFVVYIACAYAPGKIELFEGRCSGTVVQAPQDEVATAIFSAPYDTIFVPDGADCTFATLRKQGKEQDYNYRLKALKQFITWQKSVFTD